MERRDLVFNEKTEMDDFLERFPVLKNFSNGKYIGEYALNDIIVFSELEQLAHELSSPNKEVCAVSLHSILMQVYEETPYRNWIKEIEQERKTEIFNKFMKIKNEFIDQVLELEKQEKVHMLKVCCDRVEPWYSGSACYKIIKRK